MKKPPAYDAELGRAFNVQSPVMIETDTRPVDNPKTGRREVAPPKLTKEIHMGDPYSGAIRELAEGESPHEHEVPLTLEESERMKGMSLDERIREMKQIVASDLPERTPPTSYEVSDEMKARIENTFTYHAPKGDQTGRYGALRQTAKSLALLICAVVPPGREQSSALTRLEETIFHANAGIARNE